MEILMKYWEIISDWAYTPTGVETAWTLWFLQYALILSFKIVDLVSKIIQKKFINSIKNN